MSKLICLSLILAGALDLEARTCTGNGDLIGGYGWIASRSPQFVPPPADPPVAPTAASNTAIGALTGATANSVAFASVGRVFLDGNGGVHASATLTSLLLPVGKYSVNTDCTVSVTITDTFTPPAEFGLPPVQASATFEGVLVQAGNEVNLVQSGASATGATLTLKKTRQFNACTVDGVSGNFGLSATGISTIAATATIEAVTTPFTLYGRIVADGVGNFVQDPQGAQSPLTTRQLKGTYTVNPDCSGEATITTSDGKSRKISFVQVSSGPGSTGAQAIVFAFTEKGTVGGGVAQQ